MFKAAIFDLDGTLLDSMGVWTKIDIDFLAKRGFTIPETYFDAISSMSLPNSAKYTIDLFDLKESVESVLEEWKDMAFHEYSRNVKLKPYVKEYLTALKLKGIKIATATGLMRELAEPVLRNNDIHSFFEAQCFTDETEHGRKDLPDVYLLAAQRLNIPPQECIVFEDLLKGIISAKSVGMKTVGVYDDAYKKQWAQIQEAEDVSIYDFKDFPY